MKSLFGFVVIILVIVCSGTAHTREFTISQKDLQFSTQLKVIHPGDRIVFSNEDSVTHNVVSLTNGFQFDLGVFKPGMKKAVNFNDLGVVDVECTVHPNMKLTLFIF